MKIGIMSDSHDHIWHTKAAFSKAVELGVKTVIHCGDLVSPFMLEELEEYPIHMHLILGNNTGDQLLLARHCAKRVEQVTLHGWHGRLTLEDKVISWVHDPFWAQALAAKRDADLICFGHTHRWHIERNRDFVLLNPGELLGRKEEPGWALVDLDDMNITRITVDSGKKQI